MRGYRVKTCPKCGEAKPAERFHRNKGRKDGLAPWCAECMKEYSRQYNQRPAIKQANAQRALARYHALSGDEKARQAEARKKSGYHLRAKYKLSIEQFEAMILSQRGLCAICKQPPKNDRFAVDHDHACCPGAWGTCGKCVRGLLCIPCNGRLASVEDQEWMESAMTYLDRKIANLEAAK